jgi:hypothetical protein
MTHERLRASSTRNAIPGEAAHLHCFLGQRFDDGPLGALRSPSLRLDGAVSRERQTDAYHTEITAQFW